MVPYSLPGVGGLWLLWWEAGPRSWVGGLCTLKHMGNLSRCDLLVTGGPGGGGSVLSLVPAPDDLWGDYCGNSISGSLLFCQVAAMVVVFWSLQPNEGWGVSLNGLALAVCCLDWWGGVVASQFVRVAPCDRHMTHTLDTHAQ